jgi:hypothetical protein
MPKLATTPLETKANNYLNLHAKLVRMQHILSKLETEIVELLQEEGLKQVKTSWGATYFLKGKRLILGDPRALLKH